jgi:hypothetical protein
MKLKFHFFFWFDMPGGSLSSSYCVLSAGFELIYAVSVSTGLYATSAVLQQTL